MSRRIVAFGDVLEERVKNGIYKKKEFHGRGAKIVNMGELFAYPRLGIVDMRRVELTPKELESTSLQPGDLLFARRSLTAEGAGKCSIVLDVGEPITFESSIIRARPNPDIAESLYLYYWFASPLGRQAVGGILRQVAVSGITGSDLVRIEVDLPPIEEQLVIAHILGTLDDKIELNRQMNQTLDEIARTLFRSWFADFDPVRAKAEGREPEGMDAETAALFPDRFVDSELGPIPEGWENKPIGEMVTVVGGSTPSTKEPEYWEAGSNLWATPKDLSGLPSPVLIGTARRITDAGVLQISSRLLPVGSVLLSSRAPVGYLAITTEPTAINQGFIGMICDRGVPNSFVLNWARERMDTIKGNAGGTTFAEISKSAFRPIQGVRPSQNVLEALHRQASALYALIEANLRESKALEELRDTLLPELLSGRLRIG